MNVKSRAGALHFNRAFEPVKGGAQETQNQNEGERGAEGEPGPEAKGRESKNLLLHSAHDRLGNGPGARFKLNRRYYSQVNGCPGTFKPMQNTIDMLAPAADRISEVDRFRSMVVRFAPGTREHAAAFLELSRLTAPRDVPAIFPPRGAAYGL